jgi:hypothetical protein
LTGIIPVVGRVDGIDASAESETALAEQPEVPLGNLSRLSAKLI